MDESLKARAEHMQVLRERKTMAVRKSLSIYPRLDSAFRAKHSYNFDMMKAEIFLQRQVPSIVRIYVWVGYFFTGFLTGAVAYLMAKVEDWLVEKRGELTQEILDNNGGNELFPWLFIALFCFCLVICGSALTIYIGPGANGSGIAELMAVLNGVNYPGFIGKRTLFVKIVGVILGICGFLFIGKEGPLAHIGAIISQVVIHYLPISYFDYYKNDVVKREFMAAGVSAGVSAAFASPIGGALFSYELSKPTTFWTFSMIWRIFFCSSISTYTVSFLTQVEENGFNDLTLTSQGTLKFGKLQDVNVELKNVHGAIFLGIIGGALGALFINVNSRLTMLRKKYITTPTRKWLEAGAFAVATVSFCTLAVVIFGNCD
mmetsp:Transcript_3406/g.5748  ORF Transcript_3406/g.5748 Transcript_3406/m.5748 type:complete len:374 (+) Transcript_3406:142-1263(+)